MTGLIKGIIIGVGAALGVGGATLGAATIIKKRKAASSNGTVAAAPKAEPQPADSQPEGTTA